MVKLSRLILIFDWRRQGLSIRAIACKTGLCRKTIRQHLKRGLENPVYDPRQACFYIGIWVLWGNWGCFKLKESYNFWRIKMISVDCRKLLAVLLILLVAPIQSYGLGGVDNHWVVDDCDQVRKAIFQTVNKCLHNVHPNLDITLNEAELRTFIWMSPNMKKTAKNCLKLKSIINEELVPWCNANIAKCRQNMQIAEAQGQRLINEPISFRLYLRSPGFEAQCTEPDPAGKLQRIVRQNGQLVEEGTGVETARLEAEEREIAEKEDPIGGTSIFGATLLGY